MPHRTVKQGRSVFVRLLQNGQKYVFFVFVCVGAAGLLVPPGSKTDWNRARTIRGHWPRHRLVINMVRANYSRNKQLICVIINSPGCGRWQGAGGVASHMLPDKVAGGGRVKPAALSHTRREREKRCLIPS